MAVLASLLLAGPALAEEGLKTVGAQAADFSDPALAVTKGQPCAALLQYLIEDEKYSLLAVTGVQGPPGVVYTLSNFKGEIAIIKCGTGGCGHEGEEGH